MWVKVRTAYDTSMCEYARPEGVPDKEHFSRLKTDLTLPILFGNQVSDVLPC